MKNILKLLVPETLAIIIWLAMTIACPILILTAYGLTIVGGIIAFCFLVACGISLALSVKDFILRYKAYSASAEEN